MTELDKARGDFLAEMQARAKKKKTLEAQKKKPAKVKKAEKIAPDVLAELKGIRALLEAKAKVASGPVKFVITSRDRNGGVKSFKVES